MRRFLRIAVSFILCLAIGQAIEANAEPDYTDSEYWNERCNQYEDEDEAACKAYYDFLMDSREDLKEKRKEAEERIAKYEEDIAAYHEELKKIQEDIDARESEIETLNQKIIALQGDINLKQAQIEVKETEIQANEDEIEKIREKLKRRMEMEQVTMRTSQYIDVIMGAETFEQLVRILAGMSSITQFEQRVIGEYYDIIADLTAKKAEIAEAMAALQEAQAEVDESRAQIVEKRDSLIIMRFEVQKTEELAEQQRAQAEAEGTSLVADIQSINALMASIAKKGSLSGIAISEGWTFPVPGSNKSAGTWFYNSGGVHLGFDFAAPVGSNIYAVGNGVILHSANGCPTYGYLGNTCGGQIGGSSGGGNQVYLLTIINDGLYAVKYCHMMLDSPLATGTIVEAGDIVGQVGSSGNSSGAHCHLEVFYLGPARDLADYASTWNGDLSFGCGWFYEALNRRCESGVGAPCRIRPETLFGG